MIELLELLKEKNLTLGSIESLTGGLFSSSFTSIPGASKVFRGAVVTYATEVKSDVCNVDPQVIEKYGVVSHEVAYQMAERGSKVLKTDVTVSFTGNAGPSALDNLPVGRIYVGICICGTTSTYEFNIVNKSRNEVREAIVSEATKLLLKKVKEFSL